MRGAARVNVLVQVFDAVTGRLRRASTHHNRVVDSGLNLIRDALYTGTVSPITLGAVGAGGTAPAAGDTALGDELLRDTLSQRLSADKTLTLRLALGSQQLNGETITEAGLLATDGTLYARVTPEAVAKTEDISVVFTWTVTWLDEADV